MKDVEGGCPYWVRRKENQGVKEDGGPYCCCELVGAVISCCLSYQRMGEDERSRCRLER